MTVKELKTRCKEEFKAKEHGKWIASWVFILLALAHIVFMIIQLITLIVSGVEFVLNPVGIIFNLVLWAISGTISNKIYKTVRKYKKSGEYTNIPYDHPHSLMYQGQPYPFDRPAPVAAPAPAPVAAPAPAPAPAPASAPVPAPQQVTFSCSRCGQNMLLPPINGAVKITCPKCGNSFIYGK